MLKMLNISGKRAVQNTCLFQVVTIGLMHHQSNSYVIHPGANFQVHTVSCKCPTRVCLCLQVFLSYLHVFLSYLHVLWGLFMCFQVSENNLTVSLGFYLESEVSFVVGCFQLGLIWNIWHGQDNVKNLLSMSKCVKQVMYNIYYFGL